MYIINSTNPDDILQQLMELRDELNEKQSNLLRHYTGVSATLLALLTLFGDIVQLQLLPRILLLASMTCLLASVLSGVWCCMANYLTLEKTLKKLIDTIEEDDSDKIGVTAAPDGFLFFAKACPTMLCLGVLFLWTNAIVMLFF